MSKNQTYWVVGEQTQVYEVTELIIPAGGILVQLLRIPVLLAQQISAVISPVMSPAQLILVGKLIKLVSLKRGGYKHVFRETVLGRD